MSETLAVIAILMLVLLAVLVTWAVAADKREYECALYPSKQCYNDWQCYGSDPPPMQRLINAISGCNPEPGSGQNYTNCACNPNYAGVGQYNPGAYQCPPNSTPNSQCPTLCCASAAACNNP